MKIHPLVESLFLEWRVRVHNGMPDPSDAGHTKILREVCLDFGLKHKDVNEIIPVVESVYRKLNEEDLVKNKDTGNIYTVKNVNKDKHTLIKKNASKDDIEKAKKADDSESETQSQQLSDKDKKAVIDKQEEVDTAVNNVVDKTVQADKETKEKIKNLMTKAIGNEKLSEDIVVVEFYAEWNKSNMTDLSNFKDVKTYLVNIEHCPELTKKYKILSVPTLIIFNNKF